jgi:hypothetical protein
MKAFILAVLVALTLTMVGCSQSDTPKPYVESNHPTPGK